MNEETQMNDRNYPNDAASILAAHHPAIRDAVKRYRAAHTQSVLDNPDPRR